MLKIIKKIIENIIKFLYQKKVSDYFLNNQFYNSYC